MLFSKKSNSKNYLKQRWRRTRFRNAVGLELLRVEPYWDGKNLVLIHYPLVQADKFRKMECLMIQRLYSPSTWGISISVEIISSSSSSSTSWATIGILKILNLKIGNINVHSKSEKLLGTYYCMSSIQRSLKHIC